MDIPNLDEALRLSCMAASGTLIFVLAIVFSVVANLSASADTVLTKAAAPAQIEVLQKEE